MQRHHIAGRGRTAPARRHLRGIAATTAVAALLVSPSPFAVADDDDPATPAVPSKQDVSAAQEHAADMASDVGAIKASLLLANQHLEQAAVLAEQASEAYNGVLWRLQLANDDVATSQAEATAARAAVLDQRTTIGALMAASYQHGADLTALGAMMGADGPEGVLDQYAVFQGASEFLQADYDRYAASEALAEVYEREAQAARRLQQGLVLEAGEAREVAVAAATQAQATSVQIASERDELIRELAQAQSTSVQVAQRRQGALEEIARQRAEEQARAEAEAAARQQAAEEAAKAAADASAHAADQDRIEREQVQETAQEDKPESAPAASSPPPPPPPPPPPSPPPPATGSGGANQAIAYAKAQLGEPYQWGAAGPSAWDCSGLMLGAWGSAGVSLPHYSAAQYQAGTPISASSLRPGDLVFWGSSSSSSSIHHVAMYIGGGQIIHAPRTGRPVSIDSMYYWIPPNFFARL